MTSDEENGIVVRQDEEPCDLLLAEHCEGASEAPQLNLLIKDDGRNRDGLESFGDNK